MHEPELYRKCLEQKTSKLWANLFQIRFYFSYREDNDLPGQFLIWVSSLILVRSHKNSIWELLEKFLRTLWDFHEILCLRKDRFFILTLMSFLKKFSHGYSQIFFSIDYLRVFKENFLNSRGWLLLIFTVTPSLLPQGGSSNLKSFHPSAGSSYEVTV